jgi:Caspase domain
LDGAVLLRGGVFIGVNQVGGGLTPLQGAADGAGQMFEWAIDPKRGAMESCRARLVTDAKDIVTGDTIWKAVKEVMTAGVDQFILYFSGHGAFVQRAETWLLSEAPERADAAISVTKSAQLARWGRIPQVVIISDACRVPSQSIQESFIDGISVFPNVAPSASSEARVEVLYATSLGKPAAELRETKEGLYTRILYDALVGKVNSILEISDDPSDKAGYVFSDELADYLAEAIPKQIIELGLSLEVRQEPAADLPRGRGSWLSRVPEEAIRPAELRPPVFPGGPEWFQEHTRETEKPLVTLGQLSNNLV